MPESGTESEDLADCSLLQKLLCLDMGIRQALVLPDHQLPAAFCCRPDHQFALFDVRSHRLLAEDILAGTEGFHGHFAMGIVRDADAHGIDLRISEQFFGT